MEDKPERIALGFAVGVFFSFSPLIGLHTLLGISVAFLFGLNRIAVLVGLFINNPWTIVPIYAAATYVGGWLIGFPAAISWPDFGWSQFWSGSFWLQLAAQWRILKPTLLGSAILSVLAAALSYPATYFLVSRARAYRSRRASAIL